LLLKCSQDEIIRLKKNVIENFDFDKMIEYGTEPINPNRTKPNPLNKMLTYNLKKRMEKEEDLKNVNIKS